MSNATKYRNQCVISNVGDFTAKYYYCRSNKAPTLDKPTGNVDWDAIQTTKLPSLLFSEYVKDDQAFQLMYELTNFTSKYPKPLPVVTTNKTHPDCSIYLQIPMTYFCVDDVTGNIYSTDIFVNTVGPEDVFNLIIKVSDAVAYPPRVVVINITLTLASLCTSQAIAFRNLINAQCEPVTLESDIQVVSSGGKTYFKLSVSGGDLFYLTGLKVKPGVINQSPNRDGSYVGIRFSNDHGNITDATFFFVGDYSSFVPPLQFHLDEMLTLVTAYMFNAKKNEWSLYAFETTKWSMVLIKEDDYCSASQHCVDLYKSYQTEYLKNAVEIERKCSNDDVYGFKAKFGYCADNAPPTLGTDEFIMERKAASVISEVIPTPSLPMYVTDIHPLTYQLLKVSSNVDFTSFKRSSSFQLHQKCTDNLSSPPGSFFCINNTTGRIYTTSDFSEVPLQASIYFTFTVNVRDDSIYPLRRRVINLTLTIEDQCSPASNTYNSLASCVDYKDFEGDKMEANYLHFAPTQQVQRILAIKFKISELKLPTGMEIAVDIIVSKLGSVATSSRMSTRVSIANTAAEVYQTIPVYLPRMQQGDAVKVRFIKYPVGGGATNAIMSNIDPTKFSLLSMVSYNCAVECNGNYVRWTQEATSASSKTGADCSKDSKYYGVNFEKCLDPQPTYKDVPPTITQNIISGSTVTISGGVYNSPFQIQKAYWLKNGQDRFDVVVTSGIIQYGEGSNLPQYETPRFTLSDVKLVNQGYYQSCVEHGGKTACSQKVSLKLVDVSESRISLNITNKVWNQDYGDRSTVGFQGLEKALKREINERINQFDTNSDRSIEVTGFSGPYTVVADLKIYTSNANENTRLKYCEIVRKAITNGELVTLEIANVEITTFDCCLEETYGDIVFKGKYTFVTTLVGGSSQKVCAYPEGGNTQITRNCIADMENGATWTAVDLTACKTKDETTQKLLDLQVEVSVDNVLEVSQNISAIAEEDTLANEYDIGILTDIIASVTAVDSSSAEVAINILSAVDAILRTDQQVVIESNEKTNSSSKLLDSLEALALSQIPSEEGKLKTYSAKKIALAVIDPFPDQPLTIFATTGQKTELSQVRDVTKDISVVATLPKELINLIGDNLVHSYVFQSDVLFLSHDKNETNNATSIVLTDIILLSVGNTTISNLTVPVQLVFTVGPIGNKTGERKCKFWDPNANVSSKKNLGGWSTKGCLTIPSVNNTIICKCDHLTNFAIILDVSQTFYNPLALQIVSYIGCGISIIGLLLTIVTNLIFKKMRKKVPAKILVNLSLSLLLTLVLFLGGAERVNPQIGCRVVAILIQYFVLSTFFWMAVEGLNLYRNFVKVFSGGSKGKFLLKCYLFGWGGPLAITAATAGAQWKKMGPSGPDDGQFCVLQGTPFYFALLLPICIILVGNSVVLVLVLRGINGGSKLKKDSTKQENAKLASARIAFACSALLGLTWVFGILAIGALRDAFQWLFCIFNSLQGFFIFIFYTVRSNEARREWAACFGIKHVKRSSSSGSSRNASTSQSVLSGSRMSSMFSMLTLRNKSKSKSSTKKEEEKSTKMEEEKSTKKEEGEKKQEDASKV